MSEYRYILDKGNKKHYCPECNKKTYVHYIDTITGDYLPDQFGRCDRESKCTYHLNPYLTGYSKMIWEQEQEQGNRTEFTDNWKPQHKEQRPTPKAQPVFFDFETFKKTLKPERYKQNTFIQNLLHRVQFPFDAKEIEKIIALYYLGTIASGYRAGANTFPFIDTKGNVRTIQVKQFNNENHTTGTDFLHSIIEKHHTRNNKPLPEWLEAYLKQDKRVSCLFGSHLLSKYPQNPVALVEAPKTAIYGTLYFGFPEQPENLIWLAVYNKSSFSYDKLKVLQGRDVYTFPDLSKDGNTFKEWETKAKEMENRLPGTKFIFSDLLEQLAPETDKYEGYDIADYLIKQDWRIFRKHIILEQPTPEPKLAQVKILTLKKPEPLKESSYFDAEPLVEVFKTERNEHLKKEQPQNWSEDIKALENYFLNFRLLPESIKLNQCNTLTNVSLFIESHLATVKNNNGNSTFLPYLNRLQELKKELTINSN